MFIKLVVMPERLAIHHTLLLYLDIHKKEAAWEKAGVDSLWMGSDGQQCKKMRSGNILA
jgi:hypothetical protein